MNGRKLTEHDSGSLDQLFEVFRHFQIKNFNAIKSDARLREYESAGLKARFFTHGMSAVSLTSFCMYAGDYRLCG